MNTLPNWLDQLRCCSHCINVLTYQHELPITFENCFCFANYGINPLRFAAMCMQVYRNGRPQTFMDAYYRDEEQNEFFEYLY